MLGIMVWDFRGEEGNSHVNGKANVFKQIINKFCLQVLQTNVSWAMKRQWDREWTLISRSCRISPPCLDRVLCRSPLVIALFWKQALSTYISLGSQRKDQRFFLSLQALLFSPPTNTYANEILWGGKFCSPHIHKNNSNENKLFQN